MKNTEMDSSNGKMRSKLRVAYLLVRFPTLYETYVYNEIYGLYQNGVEVEVFSARAAKGGPVHERAQEVANLVPVHHSSPISWPVLMANLHFLIRSPLKYLRALMWAIGTTYRTPMYMGLALLLFPKAVYYARIMRSHEIDHIHVHFAWVQQIMAVVASRLIGVSNSVTLHAFDLYTQNPAVVRGQLEAATRLITISDFNRDFIASLCPDIARDDVALVRLSLDMEEFHPGDGGDASETCQLLSVGRLVAKKGYEYLIEACALLSQRGLDFHCSIVGEGPRAVKLEALVAEHGLESKVTFTGALAAADVRRLYQQSDVFALACVVVDSGDRDGMPTVLIEAMATGMPVVSTPVTGIPELVTDGENGFLVPERDVPALAEALETLMRNGDLRISMGRKARERVASEFDSRRTAPQLASIFREAASQ
jgi:colanic acid/amylovoran biosynthesis glycosyltransferase